MFNLRKITHLMTLVFLVLMTLGSSSKKRTLSRASENPVNSFHLRDSTLFISKLEGNINVYIIHSSNKVTLKKELYIPGNTSVITNKNIIFADGYGEIRILEGRNYETLSTITIDDWEKVDDIAGGAAFVGGALFSCIACANVADGGANVNSSKSGSYSAFTVNDNYLYYIYWGVLYTYSIENPEIPKHIATTYIDEDIETITKRDDKLFIGGQRGMYIVDISTPARPKMISTFEHFTAHDPVAIQDTVAYVTLREGSSMDSRNVLLTVNIKDLDNPFLIKETRTIAPYGLAVQGKDLYVAHGKKGMSLFDVTSPNDVFSVKHFSDEKAFDFMWIENKLFTLTFDKIIIYDVSDRIKPVVVSEIDH